jgi:hypothetical protein
MHCKCGNEVRVANQSMCGDCANDPATHWPLRFGGGMPLHEQKQRQPGRHGRSFAQAFKEIQMNQVRQGH